MSSSRFSLALLLLVTLWACGKKEAPPPAPAPAQTAPAEEPVAAEPTQEDLPVTADFEEEAQQAIRADNYQAELDALEKEISADDAP
jgi:hypothetical protein